MPELAGVFESDKDMDFFYTLCSQVIQSDLYDKDKNNFELDPPVSIGEFEKEFLFSCNQFYVYLQKSDKYTTESGDQDEAIVYRSFSEDIIPDEVILGNWDLYIYTWDDCDDWDVELGSGIFDLSDFLRILLQNTEGDMILSNTNGGDVFVRKNGEICFTENVEEKFYQIDIKKITG